MGFDAIVMIYSPEKKRQFERSGPYSGGSSGEIEWGYGSLCPVAIPPYASLYFR